MNSDKKLLIRNNLENIIKNIRNSSIEQKNKQVELSKNILLDYYDLITNIISNKPLTIYLLHLISREINNSSSLLEKELLLTLLPEFYVPFLNGDISLTIPYLSRILTSIQSNILSEISPLFIGEIYKKIIIYIFNEDEILNRESINKDIFEICQGFCFYNMKQNQFNYQLCGIICLKFLLNEINFSFLNINNYMSYIWEKIDFFLSSDNFAPKDYLLKYLCDLITKFKTSFKLYVNFAIYKILEFIDNKHANIRKNALNVLSLLISFYPNEIKPIKSLITQLLTILQNDKDDHIRNKSNNILNKICRQYKHLSKSTCRRDIKKHSFNFYDIGYRDEYNNGHKVSESKIENSINRINNKRLVTRKPLYTPSYSTRNNSISRNTEVGGIVNFRQHSSRRKENKNDLYENKNDNLKVNKRNYGKNIPSYSVNKYDNKYENEIGFRDLLNIVKKKSDNKCKLSNNFSNLRDEIKRNNNGLRQIRKIKSEKVIETL